MTPQAQTEPATVTTPERMIRAFAAAAVGVGIGIVTVTAIAGLGVPLLAAFGVAGVAAAAGGWLTWKRPLLDVGAAARSRGLLVLSGVATVAALFQCGRLAVFMVDPTQVGCSMVPASNWEVEHCCLTAYYVAGQAAGTGNNPYADSLYSMPASDPQTPRVPRNLGPFRVDVYEYPPPFLLLPRACALVAPDFPHLRTLWFALNLGILFVCIPIVARALGQPAATHALLLAPLALVALPTLSGLQKGNVQLVVFALSILAMALFARRRNALGGALLAFTTVSKLFPALLVLYLIARRNWRALGWTIGAGAFYVGLTFVDLGWPVFRSFLAHLPGLLGGEAFPAFRNPRAMAINFSIPGLVFKLKLFAVPGMGFVAARIVGTLSTLAVMYVVLRMARRDDESPLVWLGILILASLCSPFLPQAYAAFAPLWMLTMLAATYTPIPKVLAAVVLAWLGFNVFWPQDWPIDHRLLAIVTLLPQAMTLAVAVHGLRRRWNGVVVASRRHRSLEPSGAIGA